MEARWEYRVETHPLRESKLIVEGQLKKLGEDGWELVAVQGNLLFLKRQKVCDSKKEGE